MGFRTYGVDTTGLPLHLVNPIIEQHEVKIFVETGTAGGASVRKAAELFEKCYTIELIEDRAVKEGAPENIHFMTGSSPELLGGVIDNLLITRGDERQNVLFFLDAHYSGDTLNETGFPECPLMDELKVIGRYSEDAIIIIDDARLFLGHPPYPNNPKEWPLIQDIFIELRNLFPHHYATITDDYILCVPLHVKDTVIAEWRSRFHIRYPNDYDRMKSETRNVYNYLQKFIEL